MRIVAIRAADFAFQYRVVVRQLELRPHVEMALEAGLRRPARVDDCARRATTRNVQATRTMARLTSDVLCVIAVRFQPRVRCGPKITRDIFVTGLASFRADEFRARNAWWRENGAVRFKRAAGKQNYGQRDTSPDRPPKFFTLTVDPSS
jgi:hypothetical protein